MANTSARTLRLLSLLQTHRHWPAMALGVVGADFHVLEPPELLDHLQEWATRFTRARPS